MSIGGNISREASSESEMKLHFGMLTTGGMGGTRRSSREGEGGRGGEDAMIVIVRLRGV